MKMMGALETGRIVLYSIYRFCLALFLVSTADLYAKLEQQEQSSTVNLEDMMEQVSK